MVVEVMVDDTPHVDAGATITNNGGGGFGGPGSVDWETSGQNGLAGAKGVVIL